MTVPVVIGDLDPGAVEDLIAACVRYHRVRAEAAAEQDGAAGQDGGTDQDGVIAPAAPPAGPSAEVLAMLEHQILAHVIRSSPVPAAWPRSCAVTSWARA